MRTISVIDSLVTDRTQEDVDRVAELKNKILTQGLDALTSAERSEYFAGMKGAYNYTDLNRVGQACEYLHDLFTEAGIDTAGYTAAKTDWDMEDVPTAAQMAAYLNNVAVLRAAGSVSQDIPDSMDYLGFEGANSIEKVLKEAEKTVSAIMTSWMYSGEFESGEFT